MDTEIIEKLGKTTILKHYAHHIRMWYIYGELPQSMLEDEDFIPYFTPCNTHIPQMMITSEDNFDGPLPMMAYCPGCNDQNDIVEIDTAASGYSRSSSPDCTHPINPLSIDWSGEEDKEMMEIVLNSDNNIVNPTEISYSPTHTY